MGKPPRSPPVLKYNGRHVLDYEQVAEISATSFVVRSKVDHCLIDFQQRGTGNESAQLKFDNAESQHLTSSKAVSDAEEALREGLVILLNVQLESTMIWYVTFTSKQSASS